MDAEFKEHHHYALIHLIGDDKQILDEEQAVMDDQKDKVAEIIEHLPELWPEIKGGFTCNALHKSLKSLAEEASPDRKDRAFSQG